MDSAPSVSGGERPERKQAPRVQTWKRSGARSILEGLDADMLVAAAG